jgi:hypothetical protein
VKDGVEIFAAQSGKDDATHARIEIVSRRCEGTPAINRDAVSAIGEPDGKLLSEGLETAVSCRNSAGANDSDLHTSEFDSAAQGCVAGLCAHASF